jgi:hypothetical protein
MTAVPGLEPLAERLAKSSDGIIEQIAREHGVSPLAVIQALPVDQRAFVDAERFSDVFKDLESWGEVLFIVHTADLVLECAGTIPRGNFARGYYNIHGASPISGHIRADRCRQIAFVSRPFMGRPSLSIQFFNGDGEAMFKVFVRRDEKRELKSEQVLRFEALRARLATASPTEVLAAATASSAASGSTARGSAQAQAIPIIGTTSISVAKEFYAKQLGFSETVYEDVDYLILRRGAVEIHFWTTADKGYLEKTAVYVRGGETRSLHAEYQARGVPGLSKLEAKPWNMLEFQIIDPSGNLLRFGMALEEAS